MENLRIVRQDFIPSDSSTPVSDANSTIHMCPFDTLPQLESHIHPKFVIVNAGAKLVKLATVDVLKLVEDFPRLSSIITLYNAWTRELAEKELKDPSFIPISMSTIMMVTVMTVMVIGLCIRDPIIQKYGKHQPVKLHLQKIAKHQQIKLHLGGPIQKIGKHQPVKLHLGGPVQKNGKHQPVKLHL